MRDERPTITIRDAAPIKKLQHLAHRILRRDWSGEMRRIGRKFAYHILKCFILLRVIGIYSILLEGIYRR